MRPVRLRPPLGARTDGKRELGLLPKPAEDRHEAVDGGVKRSRSTLRMRTNSLCAIPVRASACRVDRFSTSRTLMICATSSALVWRMSPSGLPKSRNTFPPPRAISLSSFSCYFDVADIVIGQTPVRVARRVPAQRRAEAALVLWAVGGTRKSSRSNSAQIRSNRRPRQSGDSGQTTLQPRWTRAFAGVTRERSRGGVGRRALLRVAAGAWS